MLNIDSFEEDITQTFYWEFMAVSTIKLKINQSVLEIVPF
jgi:hypothetical protein